MKKKMGTATFLATLIMPLAGAAELSEEESLESMYGDIEMVRIATGTWKPIRKAPAIATLITAEDIEKSGALTLEEALAGVPGLHIVPGVFYMPQFVFRGIGTAQFNPQTLILINGVPFKSQTRGDRGTWRWFPVKQIARIEVVRGPGSALYGADAFAGVINIITHDADSAKSSDVGVRSGSYSTQHIWSRLVGNVANWKSFVSLEYLKTDGPAETIASDGQTFFDGLAAILPGVPDRTPRSLAPGPTALSVTGWDLTIDARSGSWFVRASNSDRDNIGSAQGVAYALDPTGEVATNRRHFDAGIANAELAVDWKLDSSFGYFSFEQTIESDIVLYPNGAFAFAIPFPNGVVGNPEWSEHNYHLDLSTSYTGLYNHVLRFGAGYLDASIDSTNEVKNFNIVLIPGVGPAFIPLGAMVDVSDTAQVYLAEVGRRNHYGFAQDEWKINEQWEVTAGIRYDNYSDFGSTINPRLAFVWSANEKLTTKLLYGRAFRAPSICELYCANNPIALGNSNLEPEIVNTTELALNYQLSNSWSLDANIFKYKIEDGIITVPSVDGFVAQNRGEQTGRGVEFEVTHRAESSPLQLKFWYSYQDSENALSDTPVGVVPKKQAYARLDWKISDQWQSSSQIYWIGERERPDGDTREPLDGYASVDLTVGWQSSAGNFNLSLTAHNLFDEDIREPDVSGFIANDLPMAGRNASLLANWRF